MDSFKLIDSGTTATRCPKVIKPCRYVEPSKKKSRKPSTVVNIKMEPTEDVPNCPAVTQSAQPNKKQCAVKSSTVVNATESSEINDGASTSTQCSSSAQPIEKKSARKPSKVVNIKMETIEDIPNCPAVTQSAQPNKKQCTVKPSTVVNAMESSEINDGGTTSTRCSLSAQPIEKKSDGKPFTVANAVVKTEPVDSGATSTQCSSSAQPIKKKSACKPSKVGKRGIKSQNTLKKNIFKAPRPVFVPVASETLNYKNSFFTRGDIVSVVGKDNRVYYAQIRGLLQNQYCEKCAVLTWLLPTTQSPKGRFDPATFIFGHEEDIPRDLEYLEFVCHAPNEYFKCSDPSYPKFYEEPVLGFAKTRKGYAIVKLPFEDFSTDSE